MTIILTVLHGVGLEFIVKYAVIDLFFSYNVFYLDCILFLITGEHKSQTQNKIYIIMTSVYMNSLHVSLFQLTKAGGVCFVLFCLCGGISHALKNEAVHFKHLQHLSNTLLCGLIP